MPVTPQNLSNSVGFGGEKQFISKGQQNSATPEER
jgi:hypothetical protein